jgi:hypothetical protein
VLSANADTSHVVDKEKFLMGPKIDRQTTHASCKYGGYGEDSYLYLGQMIKVIGCTNVVI